MSEEIEGDVEMALSNMIQALIEGKLSYNSILYNWDSDRGNDWFTATRRQELIRENNNE